MKELVAEAHPVPVLGMGLDLSMGVDHYFRACLSYGRVIPRHHGTLLRNLIHHTKL